MQRRVDLRAIAVGLGLALGGAALAAGLLGWHRPRGVSPAGVAELVRRARGMPPTEAAPAGPDAAHTSALAAVPAEPAPPIPGRRYRWVIVFVAAAGFAVSTGIGNWGFGAFVRPLEAEFGWSRTQVSGASSLSLLIFAFSSPFVGWWVDRWGPRSAMAIGGLVTGVAFVALSGVQNLWQFYVLFGGATILRTLTTYIPLAALVSRWFPTNAGRPMGILMAGFGFGGVIFAPVATLFIEAFGWRQAYVLLGFIMAAYFVPVALLVVRDRPPGQVANPELTAGGGDGIDHWTLGDALRTRSFWVLNLGIALMWCGQVGFIAHAQPFMEWREFDREAAAVFVGLAALSSSVLRVFTGAAYDRLRRPSLYALVMFAAAGSSLALLAFSTATPALWAFLALWGIGAGGAVLLAPLAIAQAYGHRHIGKFLAFTEVTGSFGTALGPLGAGMLYDRTGSYVPAFLVFAAVMLGSGLCFAAFAASRRSTQRARALAVV